MSTTKTFGEAVENSSFLESHCCEGVPSQELQDKMRQFDNIVAHQMMYINDDIQCFLKEGVTYNEIATELVTSHGGSVIKYLSWSRQHGYYISTSMGRESGLTYKQGGSYHNPDNVGFYPLNLEQAILVKYMENVLWKIILQDMYRGLSEISGKVTEIIAPERMLPERFTLEEAEELIPGVRMLIQSLLGTVDYAGFQDIESIIIDTLDKNNLKPSDIDISTLETNGSFRIRENSTLQELLLLFGLHLACNPERITKNNVRVSLGYV